MSPISPSSPDSSGSHAAGLDSTDLESEAVGIMQSTEIRHNHEEPQEDPIENMEEREHVGAVRNLEVIDIVSDDSNFDNVPLGELRAALRHGIVKEERADNVQNKPKDYSGNKHENIEDDEHSSKLGAESHDSSKPEAGVSLHDAEDISDDRGANETSTAIETEAACNPMNEKEFPCPPGKRPTGKKWDGRLGIFVPKSRVDKKSKEAGRRVSSKLKENTDGLIMSGKNESQNTLVLPSNRKKNADGLYPCPIGGRRPNGMRWDGHLGAFVPRSRFRTSSVASRNPSEARKSLKKQADLDPQPPKRTKHGNSKKKGVPSKDSSLDTDVSRGITSRSSNRWQAQIFFQGKSRYIGVFHSKEAAAHVVVVTRDLLKSKAQGQMNTQEASNVFMEARDKALDAVRSEMAKNGNNYSNYPVEEDNELIDSKYKSNYRKRTTRPQAENDTTKRFKSHHSAALAASGTTPQKPREPGTEIGSRVYACFPGNNQWYWGVIVDIKRKKMSHYDQYSVLFDDGDFVEYLSRNKYLTRIQCREKPPPFPVTTSAKLKRLLGSKAGDILSSSEPNGRSTMTLEQLLLNACGECTNCQKPDCGHCAGCISDRPQVCIQKMCCKVSVEKKAQPMPRSSKFPKGWKFVVDPTMPSYRSEKAEAAIRLGVRGLKLLPPTGKVSFYSVECAAGQNQTLLAKVSPEAFYQHIGAVPRLAPRLPPALYESGKLSKAGKVPCRNCENCTRNACGKCARCKSGSILPCLQKLCLNAKPKWIAEPAVGFPDGYRFFFKKKDANLSPCIMIMSQGGREFTLEGALAFCSLNDPDDVTRKFKNYIGVFSDETSPQMRHQGSARQPRSSVRRKPAHLRKRVEVQWESEQSQSDDGDDSNSDDFTHNVQAHPRSPLEPNESRLATSTDDFLIGRKYSFAWTDLKGQKKVAYGTVTECQIDSQCEEVTSYKVEYNEKSRALANAVHNGCGSMVPECQWLEPAMAIGGCVRHAEHTSTPADRLIENKLPFYTTWITPDARHEAVENGLPQLTLAIRGYELTFKVKRSTIPNSGNGVYLSCSQMFDGDQSPFELRCGELLDIGSYAPLRIEDRKSEPVMYVKSFIHSAKCEEFAFDQNWSTDQLDITDDITGVLHARAKKSIHSYVNESNEKDEICIWAEHDAEDSVHYLLGHANREQGTFTLLCDGCEQEVFINYGPHYEKVRVRKGYSFLSEDEQAGVLEELRDEDMKDVLEMTMFSENEVEKATNFLFILFTEEPRAKFTDPVLVERSLLCTAILQRTARCLFVDKDNDGTACQDNLTTVRKMLRKLVFILLRMVNEERDELHKLQAGGHFDKLLRKILERQYSQEQLDKLGDFLQQ